MPVRRGRKALAATAMIGSVAALTGIGSATSATAQPAGHAARTTAPAVVVVATVSKQTISFSSGNTIPAGRTIFNVTTSAHGGHTLQLLRLHPGYTASDLQADVQAGVEQGNDTKAIRRLDHRVTWLGGAAVRKGQTRQFGVALPPGKYYAIDQDGSAFATLKVTKPNGARAPLTRDATVIGTKSDSWKSPATLPHDGWLRLKNTSDEAHFLAVQRVKNSTTAQQVRKYAKSGSNKNPSWLRHPGTDSGLFSRHTNVAFHLQLPKGKYLIACFWPSEDTGMPHFAMGMWKLVHLR